MRDVRVHNDGAVPLHTVHRVHQTADDDSNCNLEDKHKRNTARRFWGATSM